MKNLLLTLVLLATCCSASAQIFKIGLRGGVNIADDEFAQISTGDYRVSHVKSKAGYQVALVTRISIPRFLQIAPEFQMVAHTYRYQLSGAGTNREVQVAVKRFELPVMLGFNISAFRLFGGPQFRIAQTQKVKNGRAGFDVSYNDSDVALVVGAGFDLGKFFLDARYNFYPQKTRNQIEVGGVARAAKLKNGGMWQFSAGFFF